MDGNAPAITPTPVRLVPVNLADDGVAVERQGRKVFRPLVIGPVILHCSTASGAPWTVDIGDDLLVPSCPRTATGIADVVRFHEANGRRCRISAALAIPADGRGIRATAAPSPRRPTVDIYGWAIMYQLPGMDGVAFVDRHERIDELPAFYECPLELLDRSEFLISRGIRHRPLAVLTRPEDFAVDRFGSRFNVFHPASRCRPPCSISRLLGR